MILFYSFLHDYIKIVTIHKISQKDYFVIQFTESFFESGVKNQVFCYNLLI